MNFTKNGKDAARQKSSAATRVPSVVGRLRVANQKLREQMLDCVHRAGFADVTYTQILVFRYEGPEGRQPTEIAASAQLSKQMVNELLGQLEGAGYLKRTPHPEDKRGKLVRLTSRGRKLDAAVWQAGRTVEHAWQLQVGDPTWKVFRTVLDQMARADNGVSAVGGKQD